VSLHPGMIQGSVIGYEVQEQAQSAFVDSSKEALRRWVSAEVGMHSVVRDGKAGTTNVSLLKARQHLPELSLPLEMLPRDPSTRSLRLPQAEEPNPVKTFFCKPILARGRERRPMLLAGQWCRTDL
jgi:hypothetical protein